MLVFAAANLVLFAVPKTGSTAYHLALRGKADIVLAEVYPSLIDGAVKARAWPGEIPDAAQVRVLAQAFSGLGPGRLDAMLREGDREEGWIAGLGHEAELIAALGG